MKFYRYVGGRPVETDLTGLHSGRTAFLVGGSPTLLRQDWRRLESRHVLTFGMNNVGKVVKCGNILFGDTPECYYRSVLDDVNSVKFARHCYADVDDWRGGKWRDDSSVLFFNARPGFPTKDDVKGPHVVAEKNALAMSVFILLSFGVSRIVLCGSTFDAGRYSSGASLGDRERNWNSLLYAHQVEWFRRMKALMDELGVDLVDTSVLSKLQGFCRTMTLSDAMDMYAPDPPPDSASVPHCIQVEGHGRVNEGYTKRFIGPAHDDCPVVSGVSFGRSGVLDGKGAAFFTLALVFLHSMADSNPGRRVMFLVDGTGAKSFVPVARRLLSGRNVNVTFHVLGDDAIGRIGNAGHGFMSNARLHLHRMFPDMGRCIWIDADTIVRYDLSQLAIAGASNSSRGHPVSGARDRYRFVDGGAYVNAGVLYMDLRAIRLLPRDPADSVPQGNDRVFDQTVVNTMDPGVLDARWNVYLLGRDGETARTRPGLMELFDTAHIVHYVGEKPSMYTRDSKNPATDFLFTWIRDVSRILGRGSFPVPAVWRNHEETQ